MFSHNNNALLTSSISVGGCMRWCRSCHRQRQVSCDSRDQSKSPSGHFVSSFTTAAGCCEFFPSRCCIPWYTVVASFIMMCMLVHTSSWSHHQLYSEQSLSCEAPCLKCYVIHMNMCFVQELGNVMRVQGSSVCDVADAHAMFKVECSTDAVSRLLCVVGAGIQIVSVGPINGA